MLQKEIEQYDDICAQLEGALIAIFSKLAKKYEQVYLYDEYDSNNNMDCEVVSVCDDGVMFQELNGEKQVFIKFTEFPRYFICKSNVTGTYTINCNTGIC